MCRVSVMDGSYLTLFIISTFFMARANATCPFPLQRITDSVYNYRYLDIPDGVDRIEFEVQASNDVHITLSPSQNSSAFYEIVIGAGGNTFSTIRRCHTCLDENFWDQSNMVSPFEFRGFWITFGSNESIAVGRDNETTPFLEWSDPNPLIVQYVGYSTGFGSTGAFRFCNFDDTDATSKGTSPTSKGTSPNTKSGQEDTSELNLLTTMSPQQGVFVRLTIIAIIAIIAFLMVFFITTALIIRFRKHRLRAANRKRDVENIVLGQQNIYHNTVFENEVDLLLKDKEVSHDKVILHEKLGEGEFGVVYKGVVQCNNRNNKEVICAVKMPKVGAAKEDILSEMRLIADLGDHQNILSLLACCSRTEPYYLVTEFMKYGDLLTFLRKCRQRDKAAEDPMYYMEESKQVFIAYEIAKGMAYIQERLFYHGDLAARNILVGDNLRIKISDFGLADDIYTRGYKRREEERKIPIKWCSLETILNGICTSKGDVWSFGVLLYEVITLGGTPYPDMAARYLVSQLRVGYRMKKPELCPDDIYEIMLSCWQEDRDNRPTFHDIREKMDIMLVNRSDYLKFENEEALLNDTTDGKENLKRAFYFSNTFIQNVMFTPPEKQNDEGTTTMETFAPILEEEHDIELTELEAALKTKNEEFENIK